MQRNEDIVYHVYGLEASMLLTYEFSPNLEYMKCNPDQNSCKLFCSYEKADSKIYLEGQRDSNSQYNSEKQIMWENSSHSVSRLI